MMPHRQSIGRFIHSAWFFALLSVAALSWMVGPRDFYGGGDGKWTQNLIRFYLNFVPPLQINALTPMQGDFSQSYPLNLWLNPSYVQFVFVPFQVAMLTSMLTFLAILALAVYACARELGLPQIPAAIAAQSAIWFFPHFNYFAGIYPIYQIVPGDSMTLALYLFLLVLILKVGPGSSLRRIAVTGVAATALIAYIIYDQPLKMPLLAFCMAPCFVVAILAPLNIRGIAARGAVLVIPAGILGAAGIAQYVLGLTHYTARYIFRTESPRAQVPDLASLLFFMKSGRFTLAICAIGLLLGIIYTRGRPFVAVLMGVTTLAVVAIAGAVYLFSDFHWWLPLPIYVEHYSLPLVFIGAVAGYFGFLQWLSARLSFLHVEGRARITTTVLAVLVVPVVIVYVGIAKAIATPEPYPDESAISELFARELSVLPGSQWNGSVYVHQADYRKQLTTLSIWKQRIPTLNEYSQTSSPFYHFMLSKIASPPTIEAGVFQGIEPRTKASSDLVQSWDTRRLAALGVRYLLLPGERGDQAILDVRPENRDTASARYIVAYGLDPSSRLRHIFLGAGQGYGDFAWLVYELSDPNHGQYTPTTVKLALDADNYRQLLTQAEFDWRRHVVLESDLGPLTVAEETKMYVEAGRIRVEAKNAGGRSLALLPIQYSNCLKVSGTGDPRLVRSNLFFAGLLFSGESHVWIDFGFGFLNAACRWSDISDMKRLKISEAAENSGAELHPFAVKSISDIPLRAMQLLDHYRRLR
jgi:hypothetical protein